MKKITEETLIPLGLVIAMIGGIFWLSSIYFETKTSANDIKDLKAQQELYNQTLSNIDHRLSRIEGKLGISDR